MRKFSNILPLPLPELDPAYARHIRDGIVTSQILVITQAFVHHAIEATRLIGVAIYRVFDFFGCVDAEMMRLPGHWAKAAHLPKQPLVHLGALALIGRVEFSGFAPEILQDRTAFEHRNWLAAQGVVIHNRWHLVVG